MNRTATYLDKKLKYAGFHTICLNESIKPQEVDKTINEEIQIIS